MSLLVIAYPQLAPDDYKLIQDHRREHDKLFTVVEPHFTLVFPVADSRVPDFTKEVKRQLEGAKSVPFCIRCATVSKDTFTDIWHTFLVPDEGYSKIVKLHDKLYGDKLSPHHRLDIDYIPHIGIDTSTDKTLCKKIVDRWNAKDFAIPGIISSASVVSYENSIVTTIEWIEFE